MRHEMKGSRLPFSYQTLAIGLVSLAQIPVASCCTLSAQRKSDQPSVADDWRKLETLKSDIDADGFVDIVELQQTSEDLFLTVAFGPSFSRTAMISFPVGVSDLESGFCGIEIDIAILAEQNTKRGGPTVRLSDGMCDAFFVHWDPLEGALVWSRTAHAE